MNDDYFFLLVASTWRLVGLTTEYTPRGSRVGLVDKLRASVNSSGGQNYDPNIMHTIFLSYSSIYFHSYTHVLTVVYECMHIDVSKRPISDNDRNIILQLQKDAVKKFNRKLYTHAIKIFETIRQNYDTLKV